MKKAIPYLMASVAGIAAINLLIWNIFKAYIKGSIQEQQKRLNYFLILNQWLSKKQRGESLCNYFYQKRYQKVGIYGYKELGERLYDELKNTDIEVTCFIDKNCHNKKSYPLVVSPKQEIPKVDVIVVTASFYYKEIRDELLPKVDCDIVSIEDVIYSVL